MVMTTTLRCYGGVVMIDTADMLWWGYDDYCYSFFKLCCGGGGDGGD